MDAAHLRRAETFCASTVPQPKRLCSAFQKLACIRASSCGCRWHINMLQLCNARSQLLRWAAMVRQRHLV